MTIRTHEACLRIIDKEGPLNPGGPRSRIGITYGRRAAAVRTVNRGYEDEVAQDKRIDACARIVMLGTRLCTADYHDPEKRAIGNAITVEFTDGSRFGEVVEPIHWSCASPPTVFQLIEKFKINLARQVP